MTRYGQPRGNVWEHGIYVIRDVLHNSGKPSGQCEYAVFDEDMQIEWRPCLEGVLYADIRPLCMEFSWGRDEAAA